MRYSTASINSLLPSQLYLRDYKLIPLLGESFRPNLFKPIPVFQHADGMIMGGGHHSAAVFYWSYHNLGGLNENIPVCIVENQADISTYFQGTLANRRMDDLLEQLAHSSIGDMRVCVAQGPAKIFFDGFHLMAMPEDGAGAERFEDAQGAVLLGQLPGREVWGNIERRPTCELLAPNL